MSSTPHTPNAAAGSRLALLPECFSRLTDCALVGCAFECEVPETLATADPLIRLREVSPGHRSGVADDAGFKWPASDLATVAAEQPRVARSRLLPVLLPEEVPQQVAEAEAGGNQTGIAARW